MEDFNSKITEQHVEQIVNEQEVHELFEGSIDDIQNELASKIKFTNPGGHTSAVNLYITLLEKSLKPEKYKNVEDALIEEIKEDTLGTFNANLAVDLVKRRAQEIIEAIQGRSK
jgi:uncharacterized membrane-anchored protein YjiN (DUF445 family)